MRISDWSSDVCSSDLDIGPARNDGTGARLDRRGADRPIAEPAEQLAEARNILAVEAAQRLGRHVAAGEAGAAGGDDRVDLRVVDPVVEERDDQVDLVADDRARGEDMTGAGDRKSVVEGKSVSVSVDHGGG